MWRACESASRQAADFIDGYFLSLVNMNVN
jgi:hypothetical protein